MAGMFPEARDSPSGVPLASVRSDVRDGDAASRVADEFKTEACPSSANPLGTRACEQMGTGSATLCVEPGESRQHEASGSIFSRLEVAAGEATSDKGKSARG